LAAGLGFALIENASYGIADINIALLRAFTAAPLHGACGIRAGTAISFFGQKPLKAVFLFISAVFIHGAYNLIIVSPALPSIFAVLAALAAFFASFYYLSREKD
ncbi:MAG: PrsW family glutamic-type intramembrane protease, partial [Treponema sp.]|nr:PrsW family glutamic-type intramembrane protease [Treponema sp.]